MVLLLIIGLICLPGVIVYATIHKPSQGLFVLLPTLGIALLSGLTAAYFSSDYYEGAPESSWAPAAFMCLAGMSSVGILIAMALRRRVPKMYEGTGLNPSPSETQLQ